MNNELTNLKYIEVPMIVLIDDNISSTAKLLMGLITTLSMQNGYCYASNRYLSNIMKVSKRSITSCITSLKKNNYIKVKNESNMRKIYLENIF
jgi:predicted HTH transcriptional regulator